MNHHMTTIGQTVYTGYHWFFKDEETRYLILRHELIHMRQQKKFGVLFYYFLYLIPFIPIFLAYPRARFELEAFREQTKAEVEIRGRNSILDPAYSAWLVLRFTNSTHGWMWPFKKVVRRWIQDIIYEAFISTVPRMDFEEDEDS